MILYFDNGKAMISKVPENLDEWYSLLSCELIQVILMPDRSAMICDEEGIRRGRKPNANATRVWKKILKEAGNGGIGQQLCGTVAHMDADEFRAWSDEDEDEKDEEDEEKPKDRNVCFHCGGGLIWGSDEDMEAVTGENGVIHFLTCKDCDASVEYYVPEKKKKTRKKK